MTVRRDLRLLAETGEVRPVHGGVSLRHGTLRTPDFLRRAGTEADAKRAMALAACRLVRPRDILGIDSGTSNFELAAALPDDFAGCVVTPSVPVIMLMLNRPATRVVGLGGELVVAHQVFAGTTTAAAAAQVRVRVLFLGAVAVDERGVYVDGDLELPGKRALMAAAEKVVLLADHAKFTRTAPVALCGLQQLTGLVTDSEPPAAVAAALRKAGVEVLVASGTPVSIGR